MKTLVESLVIKKTIVLNALLDHLMQELSLRYHPAQFKSILAEVLLSFTVNDYLRSNEVLQAPSFLIEDFVDRSEDVPPFQIQIGYHLLVEDCNVQLLLLNDCQAESE